jgi:hypothetical protein
VGEVSRVIVLRSDLYQLAVDASREAVSAIEKAIAVGTIEPLKLTFDAPRLVYPLHITSLSPGETHVQVHVLSDEKMAVADVGGGLGSAFTIPFGQRLDESDLSSAPGLAEIVDDGRDYLTKLSATLRPEEMTRDISLVARSLAGPGSVNLANRASGRPLWTNDRWMWLASWLVLPLALLGGMILLKAAMRRRSR